MEKLRCKEVLCPGVWIDMQDTLHVSISDLLDEFGWPHDDEHRTIMERKLQKMLLGLVPSMKFVAVGACPNCGVGDGEDHASDCELIEY